MNASSVDVFTTYFGTPSLLYTALAVMLFGVAGIAWLIIIIKAWQNSRDDSKKDDVSVLWIVLRGLFLLLLLTALFMSRG
jgi:predicted permease